MRRTRGFTLLEVLIAAGVLGTVLAAAFGMFTTGNRFVVQGISTNGLLSGALVIEQALTNDVQQMMAPDDVAAMVLDLSGTYLSFFVPDRRTVTPAFASERRSASTTASWCATGTEVRWHLVEAAGGNFHPARNDKIFADVFLRTWRFSTAAPSTPFTSGTSGAPGEVDPTPHPLPPPLRQALGFPPRLDSAGQPGAAASPPTTSSTASAPYLMLDYTLVDPVRKTELKRSLLWDQVDVREKAAYGSLFKLPPGVISVPGRRSITVRVEQTFDPRWETQPEALR